MKMIAIQADTTKLEVDRGLQSIAFPCISTGIDRFPAEVAAGIAVATVAEFAAANPETIDVVFCCFSAADLTIYQKLL